MEPHNQIVRCVVVAIICVTTLIEPRMYKAQDLPHKTQSETQQLRRPKRFTTLAKYVKKTFADQFDVESLLETTADGKPAITFSYTNDGKVVEYMLIDNGDSLTLHSETHPQDAEPDSDLTSDPPSLGLIAPLAGTSSCGGVTSIGNPYSCCNNKGNCTWAAWYHAKRFWGVSLPAWGHAKTWADSARNSRMTVLPSGSIALYSIAVSSTMSEFGHVAMPIEVSNNWVSVLEQSCFDTVGGIKLKRYSLSSFNKGFIVTNSAAQTPYMSVLFPGSYFARPGNQSVMFAVNNVNPGCRMVVTFPDGGRATLKDGQLALRNGILTAQMVLGSRGWWIVQVFNENGRFSSQSGLLVR